MLPGVPANPTYEDYVQICWKLVDREAQRSAKAALMGRSTVVVATAKPKSSAQPKSQAAPKAAVGNPVGGKGSSSVAQNYIPQVNAVSGMNKSS